MAEIRRILVSAYCHTNGIVTVLRFLFPTAEILTRASFPRKEIAHSALEKTLKGFDVWINAEHSESFCYADFAATLPDLRYVTIPLVKFRAFHPDMCTAGQRGAPAVTHRYSSAIGAWAYQAGLSPKDAARYFSEASFANLGYLSLWDTSVAELRDLFQQSSLAEDFEWYYLRIKRLGLFMYTVTHPRPELLSEVAKLVAVKLGASRRVLDQHLAAYDGLSYVVCPVYPEIARALSVPSYGYTWKYPGEIAVEGLENYLTRCFEDYRAKGTTPANIVVRGIDLDAVGRVAVAA